MPCPSRGLRSVYRPDALRGLALLDWIALVVEDQPHLVERELRGVVLEIDLLGWNVHLDRCNPGLALESLGDRSLAVLAGDVWNVENDLCHRSVYLFLSDSDLTRPTRYLILVARHQSIPGHWTISVPVMPDSA